MFGGLIVSISTAWPSARAVLLVLLAGLLATLAMPSLVPGGTVAAATEFACTGTKFFASAPSGAVFNEGDAWQGGTFTSIENDAHMERLSSPNGDVFGSFRPLDEGYVATIVFGSPIHITSVLWRDNDPKAGEAGWSLNGVAGPNTGDDGTLVTSTNIVGATVTINAGGDSGGIDFCFTPVENGGGGEGCTPGYWKVPQHHDSWTATGYTTSQTLESVFNLPDSLGMDNVTLHQALQGGGGPGVTGAATILRRAATASLLNSAHPSVDFEHTTAEVISSVNTAFASLDRNTMLALASSLDASNNEGCPLN
jgi:hypothetical protein